MKRNEKETLSLGCVWKLLIYLINHKDSIAPTNYKQKSEIISAKWDWGSWEIWTIKFGQIIYTTLD